MEKRNCNSMFISEVCKAEDLTNIGHPRISGGRTEKGNLKFHSDSSGYDYETNYGEDGMLEILYHIIMINSSITPIGDLVE